MQALGLIETKGLIPAIESADAMLKAANVNFLTKTYVGGGLVSIVVTGDVGAVKAAVEAGAAAVIKINRTLLVSEHVIPRPHEELDNIILSTKTKSEEVTVVEIIEEDTAKVPARVEEPEAKIIEEDTAEVPAYVEEPVVKVIEEDTVEVTAYVEETVAQDLVVEDSEGTVFQAEKTADSLQIDRSKLHNKEAVDKMVLEYGLEETIEVLSKFKVIELRNLARGYKNFGIIGRKVSKADKLLLLTEFRKYYGNN